MKRKPDNTYNVEFLQSFIRPLIYGWRQKGLYMYIGKTLSGLRRVFICHHHAMPRIENMGVDDAIDVWYCNQDEIDDLEAELIHQHRPKYNRIRYVAREIARAKANEQWQDQRLQRHVNAMSTNLRPLS